MEKGFPPAPGAMESRLMSFRRHRQLVPWVQTVTLLRRGYPDLSYFHRVDAHFIYLSYGYRSCQHEVEDRKDKKTLKGYLMPFRFLRDTRGVD